MVIDLAKIESSLPSNVSIVRVWHQGNDKVFNGVRSDAPCEYGEEAYQVNTGEKYKL